MFVYQLTFNNISINKQAINIMFLLGNQKEYIFLNLDRYTILHPS